MEAATMIRIPNFVTIALFRVGICKWQFRAFFVLLSKNESPGRRRVNAPKDVPKTPDERGTGLFKLNGLRPESFSNASAMTTFTFRLENLILTVKVN